MNFFLTELSVSKVRKDYGHLFKDGKTKYLEYNKILGNSWLRYLDTDECLVRYIYQLKFENILKKLYKLNYTNIIYVVKDINRKLLYDLKMVLNELDIYILEFNLIDNVSKNDEKIYKFFDKVY